MKNIASKRVGKNEGRLFPTLSLALFFTCTPLSECLEQAIIFHEIQYQGLCNEITGTVYC